MMLSASSQKGSTMISIPSVVTSILSVFSAPFETPADQVGMTDLEIAIWIVESNQHPGGEPFFADRGWTAGPLCISKGYLADSRLPGRWPDAVFDLDFSVQVFRAYMARWGSDDRRPDGMSQEEFWARLHNGGPQAAKATGKKKERLDRYWDKVRKVLDQFD